MNDTPTPLKAILRDIEAPPGGWHFTVPETGLVIDAPYFKPLKGKVLRHMMANSIPIRRDFDEWLPDEACRQNNLGHPWCGAPPPVKHPQVATVLSLSVAKRFLRTVLHAIKERAFVPEEEALRRAQVCIECPLVGEIGGCRGCGSVFAAVSRALPNNPAGDLLEASCEEEGLDRRAKDFCLACGCYVRAKVWLENSTLDKAEAGDRPDYWENCWRLS